jgi:hypothetical protein
VELLSILNPPIIDFLSDERLTSKKLLEIIDAQERQISAQVGEWGKLVKPGDLRPIELMAFAVSQHHMHVACLNAKLTARQADLMFKVSVLNIRLESLTKWLIGLTIVLGLLTAIDIIGKSLKPF